MRAWHFIGTVAVVIARLVLLFAGTLVGMFGSFIFIVGLAGWSMSWLAAGAAITLLGWWISELFYARRSYPEAESCKGLRNKIALRGTYTCPAWWRRNPSEFIRLHTKGKNTEKCRVRLARIQFSGIYTLSILGSSKISSPHPQKNLRASRPSPTG